MADVPAHLLPPELRYPSPPFETRRALLRLLARGAYAWDAARELDLAPDYALGFSIGRHADGAGRMDMGRGNGAFIRGWDDGAAARRAIQGRRSR